MERALYNFSFNFLGKDRLTIRELFFNIHASHKHIRIFGATGSPGDLCFGVSLDRDQTRSSRIAQRLSAGNCVIRDIEVPQGRKTAWFGSTESRPTKDAERTAQKLFCAAAGDGLEQKYVRVRA